MRRKKPNYKLPAVILISLIWICFFGGTLFAENFLYHQIYATAMVGDPETVSEFLGDWSETVGGYYTMKSSDRVVIRIPHDKVYDLKNFLEETTDELISFIPSAQDIRNEILFLQSAIESREEILTENLQYLNKTNVEGTLAIEQEVLAILKELEQYKGRLKMLNQNRQYAYADISLSFQSQTLPEKIPSSFQWLSSLDFYSFIQRGF